LFRKPYVFFSQCLVPGAVFLRLDLLLAETATHTCAVKMKMALQK